MYRQGLIQTAGLGQKHRKLNNRNDNKTWVNFETLQYDLLIKRNEGRGHLDVAETGLQH
jgi:hypothetical protein